MNRFLLSAVIMVTVFSACTNEIPLKFNNLNFSENELSICIDVSCPEVGVSYVRVEGTDERAVKINSVIERFIIDVLYLGDNAEVPEASSVDEAAEEFIVMFRTHSAEFPDMQVEYFAEVDVTVSFQNEQLISLEMRYYLFTGGAHGYGGSKFVNFDALTGEVYELSDLFPDEKGITGYAETAFREKYEIPEGANINETGFWFEEDKFHLPETVGFSADSLLLLYNPYEIASYAAGPVTLNIALDEVSSYIDIPIK